MLEISLSKKSLAASSQPEAMTGAAVTPTVSSL
jgi:hypothetical protein